ncbi:MAG TPA: hypothetical protein VMG10_24915 [Gemmataceae bacterium]|nr:hypothetical protein [Gemmataceae bacterium]
MRRLGSGGAAVLIVGLGMAVVTARGGDDSVGAPTGNGLLSGIFHEKPRSHGRMDVNPGAEAPQPGSNVASAAAEQQRHMNALIRRMEVCDRLRMIANQTGNETLMNQAYELEERAKAIYQRQVAGLPLAAPAPLSVLADDRENPSSGREVQGQRANGRAPSRSAFGLRPSPAGAGDGSSDNSKRASIGSTSSLGGSLDQREQAILEGTSMGEK